MRSAAWYEARSFCADGERHNGTPVIAFGGALVGHICDHCLESVRRIRRGSDLWMSEDTA